MSFSREHRVKKRKSCLYFQNKTKQNAPSPSFFSSLNPHRRDSSELVYISNKSKIQISKSLVLGLLIQQNALRFGQQKTSVCCRLVTRPPIQASSNASVPIPLPAKSTLGRAPPFCLSEGFFSDGLMPLPAPPELTCIDS